jgi:hypothetical protein
MLSGGISLGRNFGINITVDWSWFFIFLLVTWNLACRTLDAPGTTRGITPNRNQPTCR